MKKSILLLGGFLLTTTATAQYKVEVDLGQYPVKEAYLYETNGSKEVIAQRQKAANGKITFNYPKNYAGMMKLYFPESNEAFNFITENQDVKVKLGSNNGKISSIDYQDEPNRILAVVQDQQRKKEQILPVLVQMVSFYNSDTDFGRAIRKEIDALNTTAAPDLSRYPFLNFYTNNYSKYAGKDQSLTREDFIKFFANSNSYLERSAIMRPALMNYLSLSSEENMTQDIDKLLDAVSLESPRGQTILSELIDIFDMYGMDTYKDQYLAKANSLTCTINDRLASTIRSNKNVALGSVLPNYTFNRAYNTKAKSIYDVKANKKLIMFWASICSHCEAELPKIMENYKALKAAGTEVIGLSLDSDAVRFAERAQMLPWINDSELKGWNSSVSELYNVRATPTYLILDANNKIIDKPRNFAQALAFLQK
ncbi:MAG: AhpC/TSA family protein [Chryseobacterium sp.]|nr:MAG: AhpC/TSA family protein [Chryseobacterium sp.]